MNVLYFKTAKVDGVQYYRTERKRCARELQPGELALIDEETGLPTRSAEEIVPVCHTKYRKWEAGVGPVAMTTDEKARVVARRDAELAAELADRTVSIPEAIILYGTMYRDLMRAYFGPSAETSEEFTRDAVSYFFLTRENTAGDIENSNKLNAFYQYISGYWGKPDIWDFPYGESTYVRT